MSFNFIDKDYTGFTAGDADLVSGFDFKGMFPGQTRQKSFMLGNTGSSEAKYTMTVAGDNSTINDDVSISIDGGQSFAASQTVSGIQPNHVSDLIRIKYEPQAGDTVGKGTFKIDVSES